MKYTFQDVLTATGGTPLGPFDGTKTFSMISTDTRQAMPDALFIAIRGESFDAHNFLDKAAANGAVLLCIEKDSAGKLPVGVPAVAVESTVTAYQDFARFHRMKFSSLQVAALTGSCGKTSTKEALRAIFRRYFGKDFILATEGNTNNQIGVPRNLLNLTGCHRAAVLEAGTNHHGEIAPLAECIRPAHAMIVSIRSCHLENLGSLEGVAEEKSHIFDTLPPDGAGVIPFDCAGKDILLGKLAGHKVLTFGPEDGADFQCVYHGGNLHGASFLLINHLTGEQETVNWAIPGAHQANNAAGAAALASLYGISLKDAAAGLADTVLPGMRMKISRHHGVTWINDAYNANPDSMEASLLWLHEFMEDSRLILVLGDMLELGAASEEGHRRTLETAKKLFPHARILTIGSRMAQTGIPVTANFPDAGAASEALKQYMKTGDYVFLKASHSIHADQLETAE